MQLTRWQGIKWFARLFATPRPEPAQQAERVLAMQRHIVLPAKAVVMAVVLYYLYYSRWLVEVATTRGVVLETIQNFFVFYVLINAGVATALFMARRLPLVLIEWIVFTVGLLDGLFLAALTLVTGGFESILFWVFPGLIVINALSIPLATPQIMLNLLLSVFYLGAGILNTNIDLAKGPVPDLPPSRRIAEKQKGSPLFSLGDLKDLPDFAAKLKKRSNPVSQFLWDQFSDVTRQELLNYTGTSIENKRLQQTLMEDLNRIIQAGPIYQERSFVDMTIRPETQLLLNRLLLESAYPVEIAKIEQRKISAIAKVVYEDPPIDYPAEPFLLRLTILWLMTACCYGLQMLVDKQRRTEGEAREFASRQDHLRAAGRLAAEIAHQIKNPLGIINNAAYALQRSLQNSKNSVHEQLQIIREEVERSDRILTELMGYAQLAEGKVEKISVAEELDRAIAKVFPAAANYLVDVHRDYAPNTPPLLMQRNHLSEIFVNLLQNAREALNGKGVIEVTAWSGDEDEVLVSIKDNGPGIHPEKLGKIFEPYFTTKEKGTGLGLAIVKHNIETYDGTVRVDSELGYGTEFVLHFPTRTFMRSNK